MKKKLLLLFAVLTLRGLPQSGDIGTIYCPPEASHFVASNFSLLKYSVSFSNLFPGQKMINSESILFPVSNESESKKSPWLAFGLSLLYPGLGQLYNAEYGKALLVGGLGTVGLGLAMLAAMSTDFDSESNPDYIGVMLYSGVAIWGGTYLWSLIDAPISASNINKRNRKLGVTIFSTEDEKFAIGVRIGNEVNNYTLDFLFNY